MRRVILFFLIICICSFDLKSQNLILNSGFENIDVNNNVTGWSIINYNNPELIKEDSIHPAYKGNKSLGVFLIDLSQNTTDKRSFLQTKLTKPLEKGKYYRFKVYCKLSKYSTHSSRSINAIFTNEIISESNLNSYISNNSSIDFGVTIGSKYYNNKELKNNSALNVWTKSNTVIIDQIYEAKGGELYLTIGNFYDTKSVYVYHIFNYGLTENTYSHYLLDEVSLTEVKLKK